MNYEHFLAKTAGHNENIVVMTAENRAAIRNLPGLLGERFIDTGITEQTLIGTSAGLALRGRIPVVHALASFLTMRSFEFIRTDIGIAHAPVKLVGFIPGFLSTANGPTHQALEDIALMRGIPGMRIFCPADRGELTQGMEKIIYDKHPWYIRYNDNASMVTHEQFEIGQAETYFNGRDVCLLTYGFMFNETYKAARMLQDRGIQTRVVNLRCLEPVDEETIIHEILECDMAVTIEDHFLRGGLYTILAEICLKNSVAVPAIPIAFDQKWFKPGLLKDVLRYEGFDAKSLVDKIYEIYDKRIELKKSKPITAGI